MIHISVVTATISYTEIMAFSSSPTKIAVFDGLRWSKNFQFANRQHSLTHAHVQMLSPCQTLFASVNKLIITSILPRTFVVACLLPPSPDIFTSLSSKFKLQFSFKLTIGLRGYDVRWQYFTVTLQYAILQSLIFHTHSACVLYHYMQLQELNNC